MLTVILFASVFLAFGTAFATAALLWNRYDRRKRVLSALEPERARDERKAPALLRSDSREATWQTRVSLEPIRLAIESQLRQADVEWTPAKFAGLTAALAGFGFAAGMAVRLNAAPMSGLLLAAFAGCLPWMHVRRLRAKRARKIEEQFPDALDFLSRAMRAGHAFSVSLEMLAEETPEPMGSEFRKLYQQQNLGAPLEVALHSFAERCGLLDVQFFVSAVILQKETGGNLTEILTRLSFTIRERLRLKGQVRAASAHGKVTGMVLSTMPLVLAVGMMVISPEYLTGMFNDPHGRYVMAAAVAGQFLGYMCMRRITDIRV
jgi:tight adherence protein B